VKKEVQDTQNQKPIETLSESKNRSVVSHRHRINSTAAIHIISSNYVLTAAPNIQLLPALSVNPVPILRRGKTYNNANVRSP
jgi:hypothetical protein